MAGIRKTIYIPDEATWVGIQKAAKAEGRSVSNYLVQLHRDEVKSFSPDDAFGHIDKEYSVPADVQGVINKKKCHVCGVSEGELHKPYCSVHDGSVFHKPVDAIADKKVIETPESKSLKRRIAVQTAKPVTDQFGRVVGGTHSKESQTGKKSKKGDKQ